MTTAIDAAWGGLRSSEPAPAPSDPRPYLESLSASAEQIAADDEGGLLWPRGSVRGTTALVDEDPRFGFVRALPRSALFGEIVVRETLGLPDSDARVAARLVNIFVSTFDGVCDETPELLPATLPYLDALFAALPSTVPEPPDTGHPLLALVHGSAASAARLLLRALDDAEDLTPLAVQVVRGAYASQVATLQPRAPAEVSGSRAELSTATFAVTFLLAAAFARMDVTRAASLLAAAGPIGALYGWIDDVVDLEVDARVGRPNAAALVLGADRSDLQLLTEVTARRWTAVRVAVDDLAREGIVVVDRAGLYEAAWAWLRFPGAVGARVG